MVVYVDIDDTLVRSAGSKRIPMTRVIDQVRQLKSQGATIYLWSTAGARYAESTAMELGLADCVSGYLPKPNIIIDDQALTDWRRLVVVSPNQAVGKGLPDYEAEMMDRF